MWFHMSVAQCNACNRVSVAKEPYKRDDILKKRPIILAHISFIPRVHIHAIMFWPWNQTRPCLTCKHKNMWDIRCGNSTSRIFPIPSTVNEFYFCSELGRADCCNTVYLQAWCAARRVHATRCIHAYNVTDSSLHISFICATRWEVGGGVETHFQEI